MCGIVFREGEKEDRGECSDNLKFDIQVLNNGTLEWIHCFGKQYGTFDEACKIESDPAGYTDLCEENYKNLPHKDATLLVVSYVLLMITMCSFCCCGRFGVESVARPIVLLVVARRCGVRKRVVV